MKKAAALLQNSQPNLTRAIKTLEAELGCTLFSRTNRGLILTPEGEALYRAKEYNEAIVLAGGIFREGEFLLSRIRPLVKEPDRLTVSTLNGYAGLIGASLLPERRVPESPVFRLLRPLPIHP